MEWFWLVSVVESTVLLGLWLRALQVKKTTEDLLAWESASRSRERDHRVTSDAGWRRQASNDLATINRLQAELANWESVYNVRYIPDSGGFIYQFIEDSDEKALTRASEVYEMQPRWVMHFEKTPQGPSFRQTPYMRKDAAPSWHVDREWS